MLRTYLKLLSGILFFVSLSVLLGACTKTPRTELYQQQLFAFGTLIDISIITDNPQQAYKAIQRISTRFDSLHRQWHPWQGGELARVNKQLPDLQAIPVSEELAGLIQQSRLLSQQSNGLFNPAIGKLIQLWQFDQLETENFNFTLPDPKRIQDIVNSHPQMSDLKLIKNKNNSYLLQNRNPDVLLDFGAYAKGVAIEQMLTILRKLKIENALINAGGDLKVIGSKKLSDLATPWRIGIKNPQNTLDPTQPAVLAAINLKNGEALFTSGDYERFFSLNNQHYHHIIDPRNGYPGQGVRAVTILDTNAGRADAASTAIFLAGPQQAMQIARNMGITSLLIMDSSNTIYLSPAMAKRLELLVDKPVIILPQSNDSRTDKNPLKKS